MPTAKPRPDSVLKTLPADFQELLWAYLQTNSYEEAVAWCAQELDCETSASALQRFYQWYSLKLRMDRAKSIESQVKTAAAKLGDISTGQIEALGDATFLAEAFGDGDGKEYLAFRKMLIQDRAQQNISRRIELLERKYEDAQKAKAMLQDTVSKGGLSPEAMEQIERAAGLL